MTFTVKTLNGRFALVAIIFLLSLLLLAMYSFQLVQSTAEKNYKKIQVNNLLSNSIHKIIDEVRSVESTLHQYSTFLSKAKLSELNFHLNESRNLAWAFVYMREVKNDKALSAQAMELAGEVENLNDATIQYQKIMQNVESRYPAMPILINELEPINRQFSEAVELALQEGVLTDFRPSVIEDEYSSVMHLFQEARYAWSMQVSWFRIFVANRMGAFGDPEVAMNLNLKNRKMFIDNVIDILDKLEIQKNNNRLGLQQEESIGQMRLAATNYNKTLEKAVEIYLSDNWRADVSLIKNSLQPTLNSLLEKAEALKKEAYNSNQKAIADSQKTALTLSWFIFIFTTAVFIMMFIMYVFFQRNIRRPVLRLANQMQFDPLGSAIDDNVSASLDEINKLISSYNDMRHQVYNRQSRLESILDNAAEGIITIDEQGCIETFNAAAQQLFNYESHEVVGQRFDILLNTDPMCANENELKNLLREGRLGEFKGEPELKALRKNHHEFVMSFKKSEMRLDGKRLFTAIVDDVTERRAMMDHLQHLAEHDSLTSLYNRQYFNVTLEREFERAKRHDDSLCACIYIDLDNFKYINDTLGHLQGDRLLVGIANTLAARTRKSDILARLGGDEFALILVDVEKDQVEKVADNYRTAISSYNFVASGKHIDTGCSIGVAMYEPGIDSKDAFLARADVACHMAKRAGRNRVHLFENKDKDRIDTFYNEMGWTRRIRHALENNGFVFSCQPIINVEDASLFSYELLLRMLDVDTGEYILPSGFFDSAERFGLMPDIDRWVVEHAFEWLNMQPKQENICYFINLSGKSIGDPQVLDLIRASLDTLKVEAERVVFEITEDVAIADLDKARNFLSELRLMGFKTALDDFGVGYSSFSYLRELDVDYVKIDGSFIGSMHEDELNYALVKAINDVCHILGKKTIAEYVQNEETMVMLREIGVNLAQGYNIAVASDYDQHTIQFRLAGR